MVFKFIERLYEKYLKQHCPDCGGVMDSVMLDMQLDSLVYECRMCGKRWV